LNVPKVLQPFVGVEFYPYIEEKKKEDKKGGKKGDKDK
jgi:hypothetical protein